MSQSIKRHLVSVIGLVMAAPSLSFAAGSLSHAFGAPASVASLQRAHDAVQSDPEVRKLARDRWRHVFNLVSRAKAHGVETTKYQHYYKGLEVMGSMTLHHETSRGSKVQNILQQFDLDVKPSISARSAVALAKAAVGERGLVRRPALKILPIKDGNAARLVYWVELATHGMKFGADVLVDAHSGKILANISKLQTIALVNVSTAKEQGLAVETIHEKNPKTGEYELKACEQTDMGRDIDKRLSASKCEKLLNGRSSSATNQCQVVLMNGDSGDPLMLDPNQCKHVVTDSKASSDADPSAINALNNSNAVLNYFQDVHGRDGIDSHGGAIANVVHAGIKYPNAAWVGGLDFMIYGDGDGERMGDMTLGLDVAGHEMTHGITSKTANLTYMDESGALNEAYSDFFGKMIAQDGNWVIGSALAVEGSNFRGIRDMQNPGSFKDTYIDGSGNRARSPYPASVDEQVKKLDETVCDESNDRCWVHFNSTVPGHASYLIHEAIGKSKAEALYYLTLTQYLGSESNFHDAAVATMKACDALMDTGRLNSDDCDAAKKAFKQVGML